MTTQMNDLCTANKTRETSSRSWRNNNHKKIHVLPQHNGWRYIAKCDYSLFRESNSSPIAATYARASQLLSMAVVTQNHWPPWMCCSSVAGQAMITRRCWLPAWENPHVTIGQNSPWSEEVHGTERRYSAFQEVPPLIIVSCWSLEMFE